MDTIYATKFCERLAASLNGLSGTTRFAATSKPRTATLHRAEDWEDLVLNVSSSQHFNSSVVMGLFVRLLAMLGFKVYVTSSSKTEHYVLLLASEDGHYPGFLLCSRYDQYSEYTLSVTAQLLNNRAERNILGDVGGNPFFCSKRGNTANELFEIRNLDVKE